MERVLVGGWWGGGGGGAIWVTWSVVWSRPVGACRAVICPVGGLVALVTSVALARTGCAAERAGGGGVVGWANRNVVQACHGCSCFGVERVGRRGRGLRLREWAGSVV